MNWPWETSKEKEEELYSLKCCERLPWPLTKNHTGLLLLDTTVSEKVLVPITTWT